MCPNVRNAHRTQSECLQCASIVEEYTTNFHSDGIPVHSDSRVTRVLQARILKIVHSGWFCFIPTQCDGGLSVWDVDECSVDTERNYLPDKMIRRIMGLSRISKEELRFNDYGKL